MNNNTVVQARVTKTAAFNGTALDVSGVTGDYTFKLRVTALHGTARFMVSDSNDGSHTISLAGPAFSITGDISGTNVPSVDYSFNRTQFPSLRLGVTSGKIRLDLVELTGDSAKSVSYEAFLQN